MPTHALCASLQPLQAAAPRRDRGRSPSAGPARGAPLVRWDSSANRDSLTAFPRAAPAQAAPAASVRPVTSGGAMLLRSLEVPSLAARRGTKRRRRRWLGWLGWWRCGWWQRWRWLGWWRWRWVGRRRQRRRCRCGGASTGCCWAARTYRPGNSGKAAWCVRGCGRAHGRGLRERLTLRQPNVPALLLVSGFLRGRLHARTPPVRHCGFHRPARSPRRNHRPPPPPPAGVRGCFPARACRRGRRCRRCRGRRGARCPSCPAERRRRPGPRKPRLPRPRCPARAPRWTRMWPPALLPAPPVGRLSPAPSRRSCRRCCDAR
jgi:hypothetical protein